MMDSQNKTLSFRRRRRRRKTRQGLEEGHIKYCTRMICYATLATVSLLSSSPPTCLVEAAAATTDTPAVSVGLSLKSSSCTNSDILATTISDYTPTNMYYRRRRRSINLSSLKLASKKWIEQIQKEPHYHSCGFMPPSHQPTTIPEIRGGSTKAKQKKNPKKKKSRSNNTGFYYGLREDLFLPSSKPPPSSSSPPLRKTRRKLSPSPPPPSASSGILADVMGEALVELREMREEIAALRDEMKYMKQKVQMEREKLLSLETEGIQDDDEGEYEEEEEDELAHPPHGHSVGSIVSRLKRQREFDKIGLEVEEWAHDCLFEQGGEEDGWKEIKCNKFVRNKFNKDGTTTCFMKWMPDQRGKHASPSNGNRKFPCIKCYATINAPFEDVCAFLSEKNNMSAYNELVIGYRDLEEITPHSKICWSQCPQILFIKSRDFVTFCHLKWKRDGTQVVVNQACEHEDAPGVHEEEEGRMCRAFALRGANFIQRDPDNPDKTRFAILAHADPGGGLPDWAMKTAVNAVAPIEPFKLFHNINSKIIEAGPSPPRAEMVSSLPGRSARPGGLSQLGYACFWPNGGGMKEGFLHHEHHHHDHSHHDQHDDDDAHDDAEHVGDDTSHHARESIGLGPARGGTAEVK